MRFHDFLKAVGTGPKCNRHLTREEMHEAMDMILEGTAIPEQISAFLLGWRVQGEDKDELLGAIDAMNEGIKHTPIKKNQSIWKIWCRIWLNFRSLRAGKPLEIISYQGKQIMMYKAVSPDFESVSVLFSNL